MYGAIGTGNVVPGRVTVSLGTSGTAYTLMPEPFVDPEGEIAAFCDSTGHHMSLVCVSNLANGYNDVLQHFELTHEAFSEVVRRSPPGNRGQILIPWYEGERTPDVPQAAPIYFGFPLDGFGCESLCRAVLEGHVLNLHAAFERLPVKVNELRLTGGLSRSDAWCQTIADVFEAETVPVHGEGAALGAALHAAWVWLNENGGDVLIETVCQPFVELDERRRKRPQPATRETHRRQKELFAALSRRVRGLPGADPFHLRAEAISE